MSTTPTPTTRAAGVPLYRCATDEESEKYCGEYDVLLGPNEFVCVLTEPEDRRWCRDGKDAVDELNRLAAEVAALRDALAKARAAIERTMYDGERGECEYCYGYLPYKGTCDHASNCDGVAALAMIDALLPATTPTTKEPKK